jgi:prevent-host-death family protein
VTILPTVREFKAHLSRYLAEVRQGGMLEITRHRKPVARVVGIPEQAHGGLSSMVAAGGVTWSGGKPKGSQVRLGQGGVSLAEMVLQDRR